MRCSVSKRLTFPRRLYFLDNYDLAAFTPHNSQAAPVAALPTANAGRAKLAPTGLAHSPKRLAWLIFFHVVGSNSASEDGSRAGEPVCSSKDSRAEVNKQSADLYACELNGIQLGCSSAS